MYIIFATIALGILVFIHELGHYFMARRVGMRVEAFGIGFGKPIYTWNWQGVEWRLCWLPFGGYVKIAGMEADNGKDPHDIPDGFFGATPWNRIKVALAGPVVNILFALLLFAVIWAAGGRDKNFAEFTPAIGWVDPHSELYAKGIRPGDVITDYDNQPFTGFKDHLISPMTAGTNLHVKGYKLNYETEEKTPFDITVHPYPNPYSLDKERKTSGILASASYIIYEKLPNGQPNPLPPGSPLVDSGLEYGDRILWVDGELIFSDQQLSHILNDNKALLTIQRGQQVLLRRVPRVPAQDLRLDAATKEELTDLQYDANLNQTKLQNLYVIPYHLAANGLVQSEIKFIDKEHQAAFSTSALSSVDEPLKSGDQIIAVDGTPIESASKILALLQQHNVNVIVENNPNLLKEISWTKADADFDRDINWSQLRTLAASIGTENRLQNLGDLKLLKPLALKRRSDLPLSPENQLAYATALAEKKKVISEIENSERRKHAMQLLDAHENEYVLGVPAPQDRRVQYNPNPFELFASVFNEIWQTLMALFGGSLSPKWVSGPIGIIQVVQQSWMISALEGLFWMGAISLNLGILNLLPIPMLDGGHICISLYEMITRKRMKPKTMERLIIPFAILLIGFMIFLTYNDILRIVGSFIG